MTPLPITPHSETEQALHNPAPIIPTLNQWNEVDIENLNGADLKFDIKDADLKFGQSIYPIWRGVAADGTPFDELTAMQDVPVDYDTTRTMTAFVSNRYVEPFKGGWAFLSYKVDDAAESTQDSMRTFCHLGLRDHGSVAETLAVAQARESHDRVIVASDLETEGVCLLAPSYRAMQAGDSVEMVVRRFNSADTELDSTTELHEVTEATVGEPIQWQIPKSFFIRVQDGRVEFQYTATLAAGAQQVTSPVQEMTVARAPSGTDLLPEVTVDGFTGAPLDPGLFPAGLTVRVPTHPDVEAGDYLLLHWQSPGTLEPHVQFARMDPSNLKSDETTFKIDVAALAPGNHQVFYQLARAGHALTSQRLDLLFEAPRSLAAPSIERAEADGPGKQMLAADSAILGAYVNVPDIPLRPGEYFEVHWDGYEKNGKQITATPVQQGGRRFKIDPGVVAANMQQPGQNDSRRFSVFYYIVDADSNYSAPSAAVDLRVLPLSFESNIRCLQAESNGELWRSKLNQSNGALLEVSGVLLWPFAEVGQLFTLAIQAGEVLRDRKPLTSAEVANARIQQRLSLATYDRLEDSLQYTISGTISFDSGDSWHSIRPFMIIPKKSQ